MYKRQECMWAHTGSWQLPVVQSECISTSKFGKTLLSQKNRIKIPAAAVYILTARNSSQLWKVRLAQHRWGAEWGGGERTDFCSLGAYTAGDKIWISHLSLRFSGIVVLHWNLSNMLQTTTSLPFSCLKPFIWTLKADCLHYEERSKQLVEKEF